MYKKELHVYVYVYEFAPYGFMISIRLYDSHMPLRGHAAEFRSTSCHMCNTMYDSLRSQMPHP